MANRTIIVDIKARIDDISRKLQGATGNISKFAQNLSKTLGLLNANQKATIASMKQMTDGQKAVAKSFLQLDQQAKTVAARYAKVDDAHKKIGASYKNLASTVSVNSAKLTSAQQNVVNQWKALPSHVKGAITAFHNQNAANQQTIRGFAGLSASLRSTITHFNSFPSGLKRAQAGILNFSKATGSVGKNLSTFQKVNQALGGLGKSVLNMQNATRTMASASRAIGTSMIFAGGAFRDLGVGINVVSSLLQSFMPALMGVGRAVVQLFSALGPYSLLLAPIVSGLISFTGSLVVATAQVGVATVALFKIGQAGIEFNALMETTQISIATLITQFKNLYDAQGLQIGVMQEYTDAQIMAMSAEQRATVGRQQAVAINEKLTASMADAQSAFNVLTVEAAQSPFTTAELASGFQAVVASLGQYNISTQQAAKLTVSLGRVAAVAGVSAANMASQFTLFLTGAGRITSPLSRFASQVGLTKDKMMELRSEFQKAKGDPEKTAAIMSVLTTRLAAFDQAGRRVADSWAGIMGNMTEAFELFSGAVTKGLFTSVRDSLFNISAVKQNGQQVIDIYNDAGEKISEQWGEDAEKMQASFNKAANKIPGQFAKVRTQVTGLLSEIFNYDETGALPQNINRVADVFTDKFQPLILIVEDLFSLIGTDIAGAISSVTDLMGDAGTGFEQTRQTVFDIYESMKVIGFVIWEFVKGIGQVFGITGEISNTASTIQTVVAVIAIGLGTIRALAHAIMLIFQVVVLAVKSLALGLVAIGEAIYKIVKVTALALSGQYLAALEEITSGFSATKVVLDSWVSTVDAIINQGKGIADTFADVGKAGERMGTIQAQSTVKTQKAIKATSALRKEYEQLAEAGKFYSEGRLRKILEEGERIVTDSKTGRKKVVDAQGKIVAENITQLGVNDVRKLNAAQLEQTRRSRLARGANPVASTTPREQGNEDEDAEKKAKEIQKKILDTLFDENKTHAEKLIALEKDRIDTQVDLAKELYGYTREFLDDALAENELSYAEYYNALEELRAAGNRDALAQIDTETNALRKQHDLNLLAFRQDELNAKAKYEASKRTNTDAAEFTVELAKIEKKRQTEAVEFQRQLEAQTKKTTQATRENVVAEINLLRQRREAYRKLFDDIRQLQANLDNDLGNVLDPASVARMQSNITRQYLDQYEFLKAQGVEGEKGLALLEQRIVLERTRLDLSNELKKIEIEEFDRSRDLLILEEQRRYGVINTLQYQRQVVALNKENLASLTKQLETLTDQAAIAVSTGDLNTQLDLRQRILDVQVRMNEAQNVTEKVLLRINDDLRSATKDAFGSILEDVNNIGDALLNLGKTIQKTFQKALIDRLFQLPAFEKIFGVEGQEGGRATGAFAQLGRMMGIDPASAAAMKTNQVEFRTQLKDASTAVQQLTASIRDELAAQSAARKAETGEIDRQIGTLKASIGTASEINITAATFKNVPMPTPYKPEVQNQGEPGSGGDVEKLASLISRGEGNYNSVNLGRRGGYRASTRNLEKMTLGAVMDAQNRGEFNAAGKYQVIKDTLKAAQSVLNLDKNLLFNRDLQDKIFKEYLIKNKQPSVRDYLSGASDDLGAAQLGLAKEFASVGVPFDVKNDRGVLIKKGQSYYKDRGGNRASISPAETAQALIQARSAGQTQEIPVKINSVNNQAAQQISGEEQAKQIAEATTKQADIIAQNAETASQTTTALEKVNTSLGAGLSSELGTFATNIQQYLTTKFGEVTTAISNIQLFPTTASNVTVAEKKAYGGYISGPGGPTEDKIPAWLSNGEYVIKAAAVKALGLDRLHALNNADKMMPQFGLGGFISNIFKSIGKFLTSDMGKLVLSTAVPMLTQAFFGEKAASAMALAMPFIFSGMMKPPKTEKQLEDTKNLFDAYKDPDKIFGQNGKIVGLPGRASGGLMRFAGGGLAHKAFGGFLPRLEGGGGGFWGSANGQAIQGGAINAALSIGMALIGRWQAKKAYKRQLEEYKKNRVKDPFGMNPETLTFYKKPIITGSRNWLAGGGPITSNMMLKNMPHFAIGGLNNMDLEDILQDVSIGNDSPMTVNQNINITTPDIHSFRNSRGQLERDLARVTQRGLKRRAPKY